MDAVLGHKPATQPPVVVESGEAAATDTPAGDDEGENVAEDTAETKPDESDSSSSRSGTPVDIKTQPKAKKRKRWVSDKAEKMESVVENVMKMQSESEQHYLRLEEKNAWNGGAEAERESWISATDDGFTV